MVRDGAEAKLGAKTTINNNHATRWPVNDIFVEQGGKLTFFGDQAGTRQTP